MNIRFEKTAVLQPKPDPDTLKFGRSFSDYMFRMDFSADKGWYDPRIVPYGAIALDPASIVLNYAVEVFEGLKAYRTPDGGIQLFRPLENARRMINSAERMALPPVPEEQFLEAVTALVRTEQAWVPSKPGTSLYIRPVLIATNRDLSLHACTDCLFYVVCCPVGSYYPGGLRPASIVVEEQDVRAVRGGTGYAKCGGNYACAQRAANRAVAKNYNDVLWLDGVERRYVEEVGGMNIMFKKGNVVMTPELTGSVLPGITRRSIIELLRDQGYTVEERRIDIREVTAELENGQIDEVWGCGTAAVISPVGRLCIGGRDYEINQFRVGPVARKLYETLTGIQWGTAPDPKGWVCPVAL
ncbi:MAG: branched-chain amino acid aminotransferase [Oscillibacter sp.]|jgi:branched-chain amino acid aminotransferase|nr:branched-chain amino acid aminotransferase [Oscillibacter sp.]